jgi:UDP:flavonoid glycosyltransferase YjiC (YdhE family)
MNKKITICSNTSWYIYNFRKGLIKAVQNQGYRVSIIAPYDEYSEKLEELGCEYYDIEMNNKGTNLIEDIKLMYQYYYLFKKINPDMLLIYTIKPNIYASLIVRF